MSGPNYKDLYQKALIPIGSNDFIRFKESNELDHSKHTHWLITLEGRLKNIEKEFYLWKVTVYPSNCNGSFSWNTPCYTSSIYDCIHLAFDHAKELEGYIKNDQLYSSNINESVS